MVRHRNKKFRYGAVFMMRVYDLTPAATVILYQIVRQGHYDDVLCLSPRPKGTKLLGETESSQR